MLHIIQFFITCRYRPSDYVALVVVFPSGKNSEEDKVKKEEETTTFSNNHVRNTINVGTAGDVLNLLDSLSGVELFTEDLGTTIKVFNKDQEEITSSSHSNTLLRTQITTKCSNNNLLHHHVPRHFSVAKRQIARRQLTHPTKR